MLEVVRDKPKASQDMDTDTPTPTPSVTLRRNDFRSSTKLDALLQNLRAYTVSYHSDLPLILYFV